MIIVIKSLSSGTQVQIPIRSNVDIDRLAERFPVIKRIKQKTSNPMELLQKFVTYMSRGTHSAWIEDDGYRISTEAEERAHKIKWAAIKASRLSKSDGDKVNPDTKKRPTQSIATQVKPEIGDMGIVSDGGPYAKRFLVGNTDKDPSSSPYALNFAKMQSVSTKILHGTGPSGTDLYHHTGTFNNHFYHILSTDKNPYSKGIAGVVTGSRQDKNHIRAAFATSVSDDHMNLLESSINANDKYAYDEPIVLDAQKHTEPGFETHNTDLFHGMVPDKTLQAPANTASSWLSFAGAPGDETPRVLMKERMRDWDSVDHTNRHRSKNVSFFNDPKFSTAHREALYSKVADDVFGLGQYVPRAAVFKHPLSNQTWSSMEFIKGAKQITPETRKRDLKDLHNNGDLYKLAVMNTILGNNDRHLNNIITDAAGQIHLIDNGLSFDYGNAVETTPAPHYVHHPRDGYSLLDHDLPDHVIDWVRNLDEDKLLNHMIDTNVPHEVVFETRKRMGEAKNWAHYLKFKEIDVPHVHKGLRHFIDLMRLNSFGVDDKHKETVSQAIYDRMLNHERADEFGNVYFDDPKTAIINPSTAIGTHRSDVHTQTKAEAPKTDIGGGTGTFKKIWRQIAQKDMGMEPEFVRNPIKNGDENGEPK